MDLLRGFSASQSYVGEMGSPTHVDNQLIFQQPADEEQEDVDEELEDADEEIQHEDDTHEDGDTEDSEVPPSDSESEDEFILPQSSKQHHTGVYQGFSNGPTEDYDEVVELRDCQLPDFDDEDHMDIWNPNANQIRVGMFFKTEEVVCAVRQWNVACNREIIVSESRPNVWQAKCYTRSKKYSDPLPNTPSCRWVASACQKKNQNMWQLTKWVDTHNCYGTVSQQVGLSSVLAISNDDPRVQVPSLVKRYPLNAGSKKTRIADDALTNPYLIYHHDSNYESCGVGPLLVELGLECFATMC
ncbi:hypothetical protein R6Q57_011102 [Mikania cordata]